MPPQQRRLGRRMMFRWLSLSLLLLLSKRRFVCSGQVEDTTTAQLEQCRLDLVAADTNSTDGYLTLWEYETFVNQRYYVNCAARVSVAQSVSQWQAFTQLACFTCLEEWSANGTSAALTALPDCCLPFNNSRIAIYGLTVNSSSSSDINSWLARTCDTADAAAVADQCYTARPIATVAAPLSSTSLAPIVVLGGGSGSGSSDSDSDAIPQSALYTDCSADLTMADVDASGTLNRVEFDALLQLHALAVMATSITQAATTSSSINNSTAVMLSCVVTKLDSVVTAAYAALVCASCSWHGAAATTATTTALDISCCTSGESENDDSGNISILGAAFPMALRSAVAFGRPISSNNSLISGKWPRMIWRDHLIGCATTMRLWVPRARRCLGRYACTVCRS
jgi:hypothetical protein